MQASRKSIHIYFPTTGEIIQRGYFTGHWQDLHFHGQYVLYPHLPSEVTIIHHNYIPKSLESPSIVLEIPRYSISQITICCEYRHLYM